MPRTCALFRLAFATAPLTLNLARNINSLTHYAKGTRSLRITPQLPQLVSNRFQILFTPLTEVLFTFPSRYWFTIGRQVVLSLGRWSSRIPTGFHVPRGTQVPDVCSSGSDTGLSPALAKLSSFLLLHTAQSRAPALQPRMDESTRFRLFPVRSPLLRESRLISFPLGTEMFHFPRLACCDLCIQSHMTGHDSCRVAPFRHLRIKGCLAPPRSLSQLTTSFFAS